MTEQHNVFTKKHEDALAQDKNAILEELDLPPAVVTYLRKNARNIKIIIAILIVGILAWEGYGEYNHRQLEKSSSLLYASIKSDSEAEKLTILAQVEDEFAHSQSAIWAKIEKGHIAFKNKDFQDAVNKYTEVLAELAATDSLYPLVQFSIAQGYDSLHDTAKADAAYRKLLDYSGFASEGYLGLGRLYEKNNDNAKALEMFESYISLPGIQDGPTKELIQFKIGKLKAVK